jgi:hypothetical protein
VPGGGEAASGIEELFVLAAADDPQVGPVLFRLHDRRLPLAREILDAVRVE